MNNWKHQNLYLYYYTDRLHIFKWIFNSLRSFSFLYFEFSTYAQYAWGRLVKTCRHQAFVRPQLWLHPRRCQKHTRGWCKLSDHSCDNLLSWWQTATCYVAYAMLSLGHLLIHNQMLRLKSEPRLCHLRVKILHLILKQQGLEGQFWKKWAAGILVLLASQG